MTEVHASLLDAAEKRLELGTFSDVTSYNEFRDRASASTTAGATAEREGATYPVSPFLLLPWHDDAVAEAQVKTDTSFTIRCYPVQLNKSEHFQGMLPANVPKGSLCFFSGRPATHLALFARAY